MAKIHNRQPVILEPGEFAEWLEDSERTPEHLLRVFVEEKTETTTVEPVAQGSLFD
jgi:putative SOS response-associated peptidase YedK